MTRYVGEQYGVMMWGWGIVSAFAAVNDLGVGSAHIKYLSEGNDQNACFSTHLLLKLCLVGVMSALTVASLLVGSKSGGMDAETSTIIVVFLLYFVVLSVQNAIMQTFTGRLENGKVSIITLSEYTVRTVLLICFALAGASAIQLSLAYTVGGIVSLAVSILLLKMIKVRLVRPAYIRMYLRFAAPLAVSIALVSFVNSFDKVIVGAFHGTMEVAYYAAISGIVWGFSMLSNSLNAVMLPHLARYDFDEDRAPVRNLLWRTEKYLFMLLLPIIAMFLAVGPQICSVLFGATFEPSGKMLAGMAGVVCFYAYVGLGAQVLYSTNKGAVYSKTTIVSMLFTLCLFFILVPDELFGVALAGLGGVGAAVAMSAGYTVQAVLVSFAVKGITHSPPYPRLWRHVAAFLVAVAALTLLTRHFDAGDFILLVVGGFLCLGAYFATLALLGEFGKEDVRFFKNALNAKSLYGSLSDEFGGDR
ncbi:MAG: oligosaccharide flippase family protein [Thermoplasmatales archaeon]|nr:oligosaccharide flippase family protein [Thermoplasmatales archaeon]